MEMGTGKQILNEQGKLIGWVFYDHDTFYRATGSGKLSPGFETEAEAEEWMRVTAREIQTP